MPKAAAVIHVLFAPDWRAGVPYQTLLAEALTEFGVHVDFLPDYRRGLPLWRLVSAWRRAHPCDWLHLHWPEAYYRRLEDGLDWFRFARFSFDLAMATRGLPLAMTAHNLRAHNLQHAFAYRNTLTAFRRARVIFAHSHAAVHQITQEYGVPSEKVQWIPNGDLSATLGQPLPRDSARQTLGLGPEPVCLMFGAVEPYKGIEEALDHWRKAHPACDLHICGRPCTPDYAASLTQAADGIPRVHLHLGWLSDDDLRSWLSAADCTLFNYRSIFNSGAAPTARAFGLPILLPARLDTVDLGEPSPRVFRFTDWETSFPQRLREALACPPDYASAADWRAQTSWRRVAELTAARYLA